MCGIAGSINWNQPDDERLIQAMIQTLHHRGPDAESVISSGPAVLGHRRLSIIDTVSTSNQPMRDNTHRYWIIYNGEIYNYQELKKELMSYGHSFTTQSDTEVILEAWKLWGIRCLDHFVGMFAFALWDSKDQMLLLARDRLGEKPLYYALDRKYPNCNIVFASELTALKLHPSIKGNLNVKAINQFLSLNYILTDHCAIEGVEKLPPAHYLILKKGRSPLLKQYWDLSHYFRNKPDWTSKSEAVDTLQDLIQKSVTQQLVADVPLGAFLSGGIDSSTIVSAMKHKNDPQKIKTFSIGFEEKSYNELSESKDVAQHLNVSHHTQVVTADIEQLFPKIIQSIDEPFADSSMIPTYFLAKFSREQVKVCLSGDGGDELFSGYETYVADKLHQLSGYFPKKLFKWLHLGADKLLPVSHKKVSLDYKLKQFLQGCAFDFTQAHYHWRTIFSEEEKFALLHPDLRATLTSNTLHPTPLQRFMHFQEHVKDCHYLDQASYIDIKTWLVDDILVKVDRLSMAHSLETRAPFLDHRLVEFAAGLPPHWKMNLFQKKHILKLSQRPQLPKHILHRKKRGFNAPINAWFSGKLQSLAQALTLDNKRLLSQWVSIPRVEQLWQEHLTFKKDHGLKLFGLTCLSVWLEHHQHVINNRR